MFDDAINQQDHTDELAKVAQVSARQSLANSMVGALRRKDTEIEELKASLASWREQAAEKYARIYRNELAQELEKYSFTDSSWLEPGLDG